MFIAGVTMQSSGLHVSECVSEMLEFQKVPF